MHGVFDGVTLIHCTKFQSNLNIQDYLTVMSLPFWALLLGVLLITMVLAGTLFSRLFLSSAMIYLGVGYRSDRAG